jgi:mono/diheme cytochrome c family protein
MEEYRAVCVSCHSPRYVTMQPFFSQRQWEDEVDKMSKNYGAFIAAEQKKAVVGYLVTIHGPNATVPEASAVDDELGTPAPSPTPVGSDAAPMLQLAGESKQQAADLRRGEELFNQDCAGCHGRTGRGDGWVGRVLPRKPKDLAANRFSIELLSQVLWNGKPGTAMPSWRTLPGADLAALAAYVQSFHKPVEAEAVPREALEAGARVFRQNCAPCHGESGDGKGLAAATLFPKPANFKLKQPDPEYVLQVVRDGIPGTAMPSWKDLIPEADRKALAGYIRSLFEEDPSKPD